MTETTSTPTGATPAADVPNVARRDGAHAESMHASPATTDFARIAPELLTQVMTLEAANEARRVIADARRRLAEIAARAPQASLVRHPDATPPPVRDAPPTLPPIGTRRTPPTLRAQPRAIRQDTPMPASAAGSTGLSREYDWEQAVKAPFERLPALPPPPAPASGPAANRPTPTPAPSPSPGPSRSGLSREYEWELAVKAPYQAAPQRGAGGVLESLRSAAFPSPNPMPDQRRSVRR